MSVWLSLFFIGYHLPVKSIINNKIKVPWQLTTSLPASWEICVQVKKQQLEPDMEQQTGPNWERSMSRL